MRIDMVAMPGSPAVTDKTTKQVSSDGRQSSSLQSALYPAVPFPFSTPSPSPLQAALQGQDSALANDFVTLSSARPQPAAYGSTISDLKSGAHAVYGGSFSPAADSSATLPGGRPGEGNGPGN